MSLPLESDEARTIPAGSGIYRGVAIRGAVTLLARGSGFVVTILVVRRASPDDAGTFFLALSLAAVMASVVGLGLSEGIMRTVAPLANGAEAAPLLRSALGACLAATAGAVALSTVVWLAGAPFAVSVGGTAIGGLLGAGRIVSAYLRARGRSFASEVAQALGQLLFLPLLPLLLAFTTRGDALTWSRLALEGAVVIVALAVVRDVFARTERRGGLGSLLDLSLPLWFTTLAYLALEQADVLMLGALHGTEAVAAYVPILRVAALAAIPLGLVGAYVLPAASRARAASDAPEPIRDVYVRASQLAVTLSVPVLAALIVAPDRVVFLLFGVTGPELATIARVLAVAYAVNAILGPNGAVLAAIGHRRDLLWRAAIALIVGLGVDAALIPSLDARGAALGSLAGLVTLNLSASWILWRRHEIPPLRGDLVTTLVAGIGATAALAVVRTATTSDLVLAAGIAGTAIVTGLVARRRPDRPRRDA